MHQQNIRDMYRAVTAGRGFDVIIIVSSSRDQAEFWQHRLEATRNTVAGEKTRFISVEEDWPGGAGQLLGTLYAWNQACATMDLNDILTGGGTVAMYHTAGKGTRMAPLPAAEANNKSAIKLPRLLDVRGIKTPMTILEAVIFQTGIFAASRPGRLGVFWGDQVFIPSSPVDFEGNHHAEILAIRSEMPTDAETWAREWQSYGLIIPSGAEALQREKQSWEEVRQLIADGTIAPDASGKIILGKSLGCFSISAQLLFALLEESAAELAEKSRKLDTDPHLWMPLTSEREEFISSGGDLANWKRVTRFKHRFTEADQEPLALFGDKDIGEDTLWWDYGQVRLYHRNFIKALERSHEGECLRRFYDLNDHWITSFSRDDLEIRDSILIDSRLKGRVNRSIIMSSQVNEIDVSDTVMINSVISGLHAEESLLYNCTDLGDLQPPAGEVMADISLTPHERIRMRTRLERDGKEDWDVVLTGNPCSFAELARAVSENI